VDIDLIKCAVELASRAPSLHNTQPWQWVTDGTELRLHLARGRIVRHTDSSGREALISCGAMLDHVRVAMSAAGRRSVVERFPTPGNPEHLATLTFSPLGYPADSLQLIADAILLRRTDRLPFRAPTDFGQVEAILRKTLAHTKVRLDVLVDEERPDLVEASRISEAARRFDTGYQADLDWWTAPFGLDSGIPRSALPSVPEADRARDINRHFPVGPYGDRRTAIGHDESAVLALSTPDDSRDAALECGEALSQVLLECTLAGLSTCTVSHLTEDASARAVLAGLIGHAGVPQLLIRVGLVPAFDQVPATPRRPLSDILWVRF
jgi:hypothetical protein